MARFFNDFPVVPYNFGDDELPVLFPNITAYVQLSEKQIDNVTSYETYYIKDGERPDNVSSTLYGTPDHHWTFFYINNSLLMQGWPLGNTELLEFAKKVYPYQALSTNRNFQTTALEGQLVFGGNTGAPGIVRKRDLDQGYLFVEPTTSIVFTNADKVISYEEDGVSKILPITNVEDQYLAAHHYENTDGEYVDVISGYTGTFPNETVIFNTVGLTKITYYERLVEQNETLRTIRVLRPDVVDDLVSEFRRLIRG
jgi:hypothetical protein